MNNRRGSLVRRKGYESFRIRAAVPFPCDEDESIYAPSGLSSSVPTCNDNSISSTTDNLGELRDSSRTQSGASRRGRGAIFDVMRQASQSGIMTSMLIQDTKLTGSGSIPSRLDDSISLLDSERDQNKSQNTEHCRNAGKYTVIAFVNSISGGGRGKQIYETLQSLLGKENVFDLNSCTVGNMPEDTLLKYAHDPYVRILACGGDGTCGWIYSSLDKVWSTILGARDRVHSSDRFKDHLPLAIMPLGTGNDLSRQYGWGEEFRKHMIKKSMIAAIGNADLVGLDRWRCLIIPTSTWGEEEKKFIPQILCQKDLAPGDLNSVRSSLESMAGLAKMLNDDVGFKDVNKSVKESDQPSTEYFDGLFCNYFSLGFDATVAYLFHKEREMNPDKFTSPLRNKLVYVEKSPYGMRTPKLRKRIQIFVNNKKGDLVKLKIPKDTRAVILLNIQSYGSGSHLTKKGSPDDGLIEVIFVSNLIRMVASVILGPVLPHVLFKVRAQTNRVFIKTRCPLHCQVDGEPWLQGEAIMEVKFHTRNAILQKNSSGGGCSCMNGSDNVVIS